MDYTVENISGLLIRSKLLTPDEVRNNYQRWLTEGKDHISSALHYLKWMVSQKILTEYQAALISRGQVDDFFLNQYKILDRLGKGRMAGVYRAIHQSGLVVAIKVLPPSRSKDQQLLRRFQREARLAFKLRHPNVVRAFQLGEAKGLHYLVMEYLEGETLEEVLKRRKRMPPTEAVRLIHQALEGLQHIHQQGLIHRDLKPANLMLVATRKAGTADNTLNAAVKILDIGLGRELFDETAQVTTDSLELTSEGVLLGTPDYLAPEQARDPRTIDIRADIYSLGCVLYHCLTGQPPFPDNNVISQMLRHATEQPRPVRDFAPEVPDGLQQILNWMMAKQADQRYPTPERAAQALRVFLAAGTEPSVIEETPQMRSFLEALGEDEEPDSASNGVKTAVVVPVAAAPIPAAPALGTPARAAVAQAAPERPVPTAKPRPASGDSSKKLSKKHKHPKASRASAQEIPLAVSAGPAAHVEDLDVELVPLPALAAAGPRSWLKPSLREWIFMGIGAGIILAAVLFGWLLAILAGSGQ